MKGFQKVGEEFLTVDAFGVPDNPGGKRCRSLIEPLQEFVAGRLAGCCICAGPCWAGWPDCGFCKRSR